MRARLLASAVVLFVGSVALATAGSDTKMPCTIQPKNIVSEKDLAEALEKRAAYEESLLRSKR